MAGAVFAAWSVAALPAGAQEGPLLYVPTVASDVTRVIDTSTNTVLPSTVAGDLPAGAAVRGDQAFAYIANAEGDSVSVVDTASSAVVATVPVGARPEGMALGPDGRFLYVANYADRTVSVIDTANNTVSATITVGDNPLLLAVSPDGKRVYVPNVGSNTVSVIDTASNTVVGSVNTGGQPAAVAVSPDGARAYVTSYVDHHVYVIDTAAGAAILAIPVGNVPEGLQLSPDGSLLYVPNVGDGTISVISTSNYATVATIGGLSQPNQIVFTPDGSRAYVTERTGSVAVIDTVTNTVIQTLAVGGGPYFEGICSRGNALLGAGATFMARTSGALGCLGPAGAVFTGGTLQTVGANIASAAPITFAAAGGVIDTAGQVATLAGPVSGPGGLTKIGAGTLVLSGAASYSGATTVGAGTLQAGAAGAFSPLSAFTVRSGATLDLNGFDQTIGSLAGAGAVSLGAARLSVGGDGASAGFSGAIGGTGGLVKQGAGTLVLTGASTYSGGTRIEGGLLQLGDGGASGSIAGDVVDDAALAFDRSDTATFAGTISGGGEVRQVGRGQTVLTGRNSYTGATTVSAGTLIVDGSIAASFLTTVTPGARLAGGGVVGPTQVGGTIAPGRSIGVLTVAGDLALGSGSTYEVEIDAEGRADMIHVTGAAALSGGAVSVLAADEAYAPGRRYTILTADGGVQGAFGSLTRNLVFLDLNLVYEPDRVFLDVVRNATPFCDVAAKANECAAGAAAESLGVGNPLYDAIVRLPDAASARRAFDLLSGELHASTGGAVLEDSRFVRDAGLARMRAALGGVAAPDLAYGGGSTDAGADERRPVVWADGFGSWGKWNGGDDAASLGRSIGGVFVGVDAPIGGTGRLGLIAGYSHSNFDLDERNASGEADSAHLGVYGGARWGAVGFRAGAAYTWNSIDTRRTIVFPGFDNRLTADYHARVAQAFAELGRRFDVARISYEPFVNLAYVDLDADGFTERGGLAALTSAENDADATFATAGVRAETALRLAGRPLHARGAVGWRHDFRTSTPLAEFAFQGGAPFRVSGAPIARNAAVIEAGLALDLSAATRFSVSYSGQVADRAEEHGVRASFTARF